MSRRPKKRCAVCGQDIVPDPLVDPGNPPHRQQACTTAHPTRAHHRMVTLAKSSPSRSTPRPSQNETATVMLGMIADYMDSLVTYGAAFYRNLFWEAGLVGQVLYLEAEEASIRSTGIGCYFDEPVHEVFGISSRDWQSFYHFTVGGPVEDRRLTTLPAYNLGEAG